MIEIFNFIKLLFPPQYLQWNKDDVGPLYYSTNVWDVILGYLFLSAMQIIYLCILVIVLPLYPFAIIRSFIDVKIFKQPVEATFENIFKNHCKSTPCWFHRQYVSDLLSKLDKDSLSCEAAGDGYSLLIRSMFLRYVGIYLRIRLRYLIKFTPAAERLTSPSRIIRDGLTGNEPFYWN